MKILNNLDGTTYKVNNLTSRVLILPFSPFGPLPNIGILSGLIVAHTNVLKMISTSFSDISFTFTCKTPLKPTIEQHYLQVYVGSSPKRFCTNGRNDDLSAILDTIDKAEEVRYKKQEASTVLCDYYFRLSSLFTFRWANMCQRPCTPRKSTTGRL